MDVELITNAEWEIMRVVWTKKTTTSTEIIQLLKERLAWKPSTVKTLLNRLVEKDFLATEKVGKAFIYSAKVPELTATKSLAEDLERKICARKIPNFVEQVIIDSDFTLENIEALQALLDEKKKTTVEKISCNCLPDNCHCETC